MRELTKDNFVSWATEDHHMHTIVSDGEEGRDTVAYFAARAGLQRITITDHSDAIESLDWFVVNTQRCGFPWLSQRFRGVGIDAQLGVEADLLDEDGNICDTISDVRPEYMVLSVHKEMYCGHPTTITKAYQNAIERHGDRINALGHPDMKDFAQHLDMVRLCEVANAHGIPLELNGSMLMNGNTDQKLFRTMLEHGNSFIVNSDAHNRFELIHGRRMIFDHLVEEKYISPKFYEKVCAANNWTH